MEPPWEPDCSPHRDSHGGHPNGPRGVPLKMPSGKAPLRWPLSPVSFTPITNLPEPARATEDAVWEALTHRSCHLLVLPPIATPTDPTIFFLINSDNGRVREQAHLIHLSSRRIPATHDNAPASKAPALGIPDSNRQALKRHPVANALPVAYEPRCCTATKPTPKQP